MYGHDLGQTEQYFGPPPPGQTWQTYEDTQTALAKQLALGAGIVTAAAIHPLLGLAAGVTALIYGGSGMHQHKPGQQGG